MKLNIAVFTFFMVMTSLLSGDKDEKHRMLQNEIFSIKTTFKTANNISVIDKCKLKEIKLKRASGDVEKKFSISVELNYVGFAKFSEQRLNSKQVKSGHVFAIQINKTFKSVKLDENSEIENKLKVLDLSQKKLYEDQDVLIELKKL